MKKYIVILFLLVAVVACKNSETFRTYEEAEKEFRQSLTFRDTLMVLTLGQNFMDALKSGEIQSELANLCVLDCDTLYKVSDRSLVELQQRFSSTPVSDYALASYSFSTPGNNDLSFRYVTSGKIGSSPAMKIMFNPVKVGENWYLTLKDGNMSSLDKDPRVQVHPLSPAPAPIVLNTK